MHGARAREELRMHITVDGQNTQQDHPPNDDADIDRLQMTSINARLALRHLERTGSRAPRATDATTASPVGPAFVSKIARNDVAKGGQDAVTPSDL